MEFQIDDIDFRSIVLDLIKNIWVIILAVLAVRMGISGYYELTYEPQYTSTATLAVTARGSSNGSYSSLTTAMNMADVFSEVFQSDALKKMIEADIGESNIQGTINSSIISQTNLITLTVTSDTPAHAYQMIQSALDNYSSVSDYLFSNASLQMVKEPNVPYGPSNYVNYSRIQRMATLAAGGLTAAVIVLVSILRPTVKRKSSARRQLDGRILATIPYERKYKSIHEYLHKPKKSVLIASRLLSMPFTESNRKLATLIERHMTRHQQKVLLVCSVAENEGKSSVASNIALALADRHKKVLLVDCDLRKPALHRIFDLHDQVKYSLSEYLLGQCSFEQVITELPNGLHIICQTRGLNNSTKYIMSKNMLDFILKCRENYDLIVLDTPPIGAGVDVEAILNYGDTSIMTVRQDWSEIGAINDFSDLLKQNDKEFMGFVLNAFHENILIEKSYGQYPYQNYQSRSVRKAEE